VALVAIDWRPSAKQLRCFGAAAALLAGGIATWVFFRHSLFGFAFGPPASRTAAWVLWGVGAACLASALAAPRALWPLYVLLNVVTLPIGFVLSYVILLAMFYLVITPVALLFRLIGRDALHRKFDRQAESYWTPCEGPPPAKRYFKQF